MNVRWGIIWYSGYTDLQLLTILSFHSSKISYWLGRIVPTRLRCQDPGSDSEQVPSTEELLVILVTGIVHGIIWVPSKLGRSNSHPKTDTNLKNSMACGSFYPSPCRSRKHPSRQTDSRTLQHDYCCKFRRWNFAKKRVENSNVYNISCIGIRRTHGCLRLWCYLLGPDSRKSVRHRDSSLLLLQF